MRNWNVSLNNDVTHPICVELNNGGVRLDLQVKQTAILVSFLTNESAQPAWVELRNGEWCGVRWADADHLLGDRAVIFNTRIGWATLAEGSAVLLVNEIEQAMGVVNLARAQMPKSAPDSQPADSLDGPMRRTNDNLQGVFG